MKYFALLLSLALFAACGDNNVSSDTEFEAMEATRTAQAAAYEGMVDAHDRVMPLMGKITAAQKAIKEHMEVEGLSDDREDLLEAAYEELEDAGDDMMEWMQEHKTLETLRETMDNDEITDYIREESADIAKIETRMKTAIAGANQLVGNHDDHDHDHGDGDHDHMH